MDSKTSLAIIQRVRAEREKRGAPDVQAFQNSVQQAASQELRADALRDIRNLGLTTLGIGAGGAGLVGLINMMRRNTEPKKRSGPALLPLPYPVEPALAPENIKQGGVLPDLGGADAATKGGIPWYYPAMFGVGMGGLGLGWKGMDYILDKRRKEERQQELDLARNEFQDALLAQYDKPLGNKKAADSTMLKVGEALDALWNKMANAIQETITKEAVDWNNLGGQVLGGYGAYAGLTGLLAGTLVYDKMKKRSRRAILEKALQRRQRREFNQRPTEIFAVPEPVERLPQPSFRQEMSLLEG